MIEEIHVYVSGKVQGVGFRSSVKRHAIQHGLKGFVRNLEDGRVEICAQGTEQAINAFLSNVRSNSRLAAIDRFEIKKKSCGKAYAAFKIIY